MSLFAALTSSAQTLSAYQRSLSVTQNNVSNASTPGYVRQRLNLNANWFDPDQGLPGGVSAGDIESSRKQYAERAVWRQSSLHGQFEEMSSALSRIEGSFDATGKAGIPLALSRFFDAFSQLSVTPNDTIARQTVLNRAQDVAREIRSTGDSLAREQSAAVEEAQNTLSRISELSARVRAFNSEVRQSIDSGADAGLDAQVHATLEELSSLVDIEVHQEKDGTFTVLAGGESALVLGDQMFTPDLEFDGTNIEITDKQGNIITDVIQGGALRANLDLVNKLLPDWRSQLNTLAASLADSVNTTLAAGLDRNELPGAALFDYDDPSTAARSLQITDILPEEIAAASGSAPGGNGNALDLAALGQSTAVNGMTFAGFYGGIASAVGRETLLARDNSESFSSLLVQAKELRKQESGVSLDEEAVRLIEIQRAYQATARLVTVLDSLTETTLNMLRA